MSFTAKFGTIRSHYSSIKYDIHDSGNIYNLSISFSSTNTFTISTNLIRNPSITFSSTNTFTISAHLTYPNSITFSSINTFNSSLYKIYNQTITYSSTNTFSEQVHIHFAPTISFIETAGFGESTNEVGSDFTSFYGVHNGKYQYVKYGIGVTRAAGNVYNQSITFSSTNTFNSNIKLKAHGILPLSSVNTFILSTLLNFNPNIHFISINGYSNIPILHIHNISSFVGHNTFNVNLYASSYYELFSSTNQFNFNTSAVLIRNIIQPLHLIQQIGIQHNINPTISQNLNLTQSLQVTKVSNLNLIQNLNIIQGLGTYIPTVFAGQNLNLVQSSSGQKVIVENIQQLLVLNQKLQRNNSFNLSISQQLIFNTFYLQQLRVANLQISVPRVQYVKITPGVVILQTTTSAIVLPSADLGDGYSLSGGIINIKRSMNNVLYVYNRYTPVKRLSYTFQLGTQKALELRQFILQNIGNLITMTNWKGQIWMVYITNNPVDISTRSKYASICGPKEEKNQVVLDFEGERIF